MGNPIELLYSWQALLLAGLVMGLTQFIKTVIDLKISKEARKNNPVLNTLIMPALNPLFGFLIAMVIPARPEVLIEYATTHVLVQWESLLVFGAWGAAVGQFADYIFSKVKTAMSALKNKTPD